MPGVLQPFLFPNKHLDGGFFQIDQLLVSCYASGHARQLCICLKCSRLAFQTVDCAACVPFLHMGQARGDG